MSTKIISINGVPVAPTPPVSGSFAGPLDSGLRIPSNQLPTIIDSRVEVLSFPESTINTYVLGQGEIANPTDRPYLRKGDGVTLGGQIVGLLRGNGSGTNSNIYSAVSVSGSVSGNSRGVGSVDLQQSRVASTQVASGNYSTIGGGSSNTASTIRATVGGGQGNTASGYYSTVAGGYANAASGQFSTVGGGGSNTASAGRATVGGGGGNTASNYYSTVGGGINNTASGDISTVGGGSSNAASGQFSTVGGGGSNTASADRATVGGGGGNTASNYYSTVGGGRYNTASANYSTVGGGINNTASGYFSAVAGGVGNTASGYYSTIAGGNRAKADRLGMEAYSSGVFGVQGDAQRASFILRKTTINNTPTTLFLDEVFARLTIPNNKIMSFIANITGVRDGGADVAMYVRQGIIKNVSGITSLVGTINTVGVDIESNSATDVAITADDSNDALQINVTGITGQAWRWVAHVQAVEIGIG